MATTKITKVNITGTDTTNVAAFNYNVVTNVRSGAITITFNGSTITFPSVANYQTFLAEIVKPLTDSVNSVSGAGVGFVAATVGTPGADTIKDA